MEDNRNRKKMKDEMEKTKEEFLSLTIELMDAVVKFCVRALKTFEAGKGEELNLVQINEIATKEVLAVILQISDQKFIDLAARKAEETYRQYKLNKK